MQKQMQYTAENILVRPTHNVNDLDLILAVTPEEAGWDYISFQVRQLATGQSWSFHSGANELAIVNFTGVYTVTSNGEWREIGGRANVFAGAAVPSISRVIPTLRSLPNKVVILPSPGFQPTKITSPG